MDNLRNIVGGQSDENPTVLEALWKCSGLKQTDKESNSNEYCD